MAVKKQMFEGKTFSLFRGKRARVYIEKNGAGGGARLLLVVKVGGDTLTRSYTRYPLDEVKRANDDAANAEQDAATAGELGLLSDRERDGVRAYREAVADFLSRGIAPPSMADMIRRSAALAVEEDRAGTFDAAVEDFYRMHRAGWKPKRAREITSCISRFRAALDCGSKRLTEFTAEEVVRGVQLMAKEGAKLTTIVFYLSDLKRLFERAREVGKISLNPCKEALRMVARPKHPRGVATLSVEESRRLLAAALLHPNRGEALLYVVRLLTGCRASEASRLQWGDFRLDEEQPHIFLAAGKAKTAMARCIYLQGSHAEVVRAFLPRRYRKTDARVCAERSAEAVEHRLPLVSAAIAARAGLTSGAAVTKNVLRHTAASYLVAHFGEVGKAALILGHTEAVCRKHYLGLIPKREADKFFRLAPPSAEQTHERRARKYA